MEYVIMVAIGLGSFILGAYCFNGIVIPLFYTLPRVRKEKASGNLEKPIPLLKLVLSPFLAAAVFSAVLYVSYPYYVDYPWAIFIGLGIAAVGVYSKMKSTKGEKEADFLENYGEFLKKK